MAQASDSGISELRGYAGGLEGDLAVVEAGLRLVSSSVRIRGSTARRAGEPAELGRDCHRGGRIALQQGTEVPAVDLQQYPVFRAAHGRCVLRLGDQRDLAEELTRFERPDQGVACRPQRR